MGQEASSMMGDTTLTLNQLIPASSSEIKLQKSKIGGTS
jgi:hypothetical protein